MRLKQDGFAHLALLLILVVVAVLGFVGWRVYSSNNQKALNSITENDEEAEETLPEDLNGLLTVEKITELALAEKPGSEVSIVELENEDQNLVYKVVFSDGTTIKFNAASGNKIAGQLDQEEVGEGTLPAQVQITLVEAVSIAKQELPGKQVRKVQLDVEDGAVVYSVRFTDGSRVDVNAKTGDVVSTRDNSRSSSGQSSGQGSSKKGGNSGDSDDDQDTSGESDDEGDDDSTEDNSGSSN